MAIRSLFESYAASLPVDLNYQDFEGEVTGLPGKYAEPRGVLLLAYKSAATPVGCIGMRPMPPPAACEMKRLYVAPQARGSGVGKALATALIEDARSRGYREMFLDTLPSMAAAQSFYRALGFERVDPYYDTAFAGTAFYRLALQPAISPS